MGVVRFGAGFQTPRCSVRIPPTEDTTYTLWWGAEARKIRHDSNPMSSKWVISLKVPIQVLVSSYSVCSKLLCRGSVLPRPWHPWSHPGILGGTKRVTTSCLGAFWGPMVVKTKTRYLVVEINCKLKKDYWVGSYKKLVLNIK